MRTEPESLVEHPLTSESVFSGKLLKVYKDRVRLPDAAETEREWIDHPGAAAIIPVFDDGTTLLVEQYRYAVRSVMLEIPAGKRDGDEPFSETALRELAEETGLQAGALHDLGMAYPVIGYSNEIIWFFAATDLTQGATQQEEDEFLRLRRIPFDEALELAADGTIQDMKTIVGLHRTARMLSSNDG